MKAFEDETAAELKCRGVWGSWVPQGGPGAQPLENVEILEHLNRILAITNFIILNDINIISIQGNIFGKIPHDMQFLLALFREQ